MAIKSVLITSGGEGPLGERSTLKTLGSAVPSLESPFALTLMDGWIALRTFL